MADSMMSRSLSLMIARAVVFGVLWYALMFLLNPGDRTPMLGIPLALAFACYGPYELRRSTAGLSPFPMWVPLTIGCIGLGMVMWIALYSWQNVEGTSVIILGLVSCLFLGLVVFGLRGILLKNSLPKD